VNWDQELQPPYAASPASALGDFSQLAAAASLGARNSHRAARAAASFPGTLAVSVSGRPPLLPPAPTTDFRHR
jgi:hypothetical protein